MATNRLYRSKYGQFFGVCKGIARWRDLPVKGVRLIFVVIALCTAVFPCLVIYIIAGICIPTDPDEEPSNPDSNGPKSKNHSYNTYTGMDSSSNSYEDDEALRSRYEDLKKKVEKMEQSIMDKENDWDARFNREDK